jgi:hypothetical protein
MRPSLGLARLAARVAVLALFLALAPGAALANHVQCGDVITQDTTLDSDLTCAGDGLHAAAPNVTLDLGGHTISGSGTGTAVTGVPDHVTIRGGTISNFQYGVYADGSRGTSIARMTFEGNQVGVRCSYAPECRIEGNVFRANTGFAIRIFSPDGGDPKLTVVRRNDVTGNGNGIEVSGEAGLVEGNRVEGNRLDGISTSYGKPVTIRRNLVAGNGDEGVRVFFGITATVTNNRITENGTNGVGVHGGAGEGTEGIVRDNRIGENGQDGILIDGISAYATVERNDTFRNGDDGIGVDLIGDCCLDVTIRKNKSFFNSDLGVEASPGTTTDGGGNKAKHNGNPAQCVGVRCK